MSDFDEDQFVDPGTTDDIAQRLTHRERILRELFVKEYLVDYDAMAAATRIGYGVSYAKEYAVRFMNCPFVLQLISKHEQEDDVQDPDIMRRMVIKGLIREANYRGPGASAGARVAAFAKLSAIHGFDAPVKTQTDVTGLEGGGLFVVPGVMSVEEWEAAAGKQQEDLVAGRIEQVAQV